MEQFDKTMERFRESCQILDFNWRFIYANNAVLKQSRYSREELQNLTLKDAYPGIESTDVFKRLQESMAKRIPNQAEYETILTDGAKAVFKLNIEPVPEGILVYAVDSTVSKKLESVFSVYRERLEEVIVERSTKLAQTNSKLEQVITDYKKATGALHLRATILEKVTESILLLDLFGRFIYVNEAASRMYGFTKYELIKMSLPQLVAEEEQPTLQEKLRELLKYGEMQTEMTHIKKDRSLIPVRLYSSIINLPAGRCIISAVRDISRERQIEEALRRCEIQLTLH